MSKGKTFGCLKCGKPFTVYPPDDLHPTASLNKEDLVNTVEMKHKCECGNTYILYWGSAPIDRDRSIREEIKKELMYRSLVIGAIDLSSSEREIMKAIISQLREINKTQDACARAILNLL